MPDALEHPRLLRAIVELVRGQRLSLGRGGVIDELVALTFWHGAIQGRAATRSFPRLAAVARALNHLPEPAAGLRGVNAIRIGGRSLHVIDLPAGEKGSADVPLLPLAVRSQDERALARAR